MRNKKKRKEEWKEIIRRAAGINGGGWQVRVRSFKRRPIAIINSKIVVKVVGKESSDRLTRAFCRKDFRYTTIRFVQLSITLTSMFLPIRTTIYVYVSYTAPEERIKPVIVKIIAFDLFASEPRGESSLAKET